MAIGTEVQGRKDDSGKLRFDLLPFKPLWELCRVYTIGAVKYADRNWEKGIIWGRIFAAMMRHAWKWWNGEKLDQMDGQHHLASVAWCAFALMEYEDTHPEMDDRPTTTKIEIKPGAIYPMGDPCPKCGMPTAFIPTQHDPIAAYGKCTSCPWTEEPCSKQS